MKSLQATVTTTHDCADLLSEILIDLGSEGTAVNDYEDIRQILAAKHNWDYADKALYNSDSKVYVTGYFDCVFDVNLLLYALEEFKGRCEFECGSLETVFKEINSEDWSNVWKKFYAPIQLSNVVIVPEWLDGEYDKAKVLIDPGLAFGTGQHETTSMCIELMQKSEMKGKTVFDIGCGSGILGIAALKLGAEKCIFVDIDAQAIAATTHNLKLNGLVHMAEVCQGDLLSSIGERKADVIIANITADILIRLSKDILSFASEKSDIIISGIINSRAEDVLNVYGSLFEIKHSMKDNEWQAFGLKVK